MTTTELETHLDVAARWVIHLAFETWTEEAWGDYMPEIGRHDFDRIIERAERLLPGDVTLEQIHTTHAWFASRAESEVTK